MLVCGRNLVSPAFARVPHPVGTAPALEPVYCLTTMPANDVLAIVEFCTTASLMIVGTLGGAPALGTVVSMTMPPVRFEESQPAWKVMPGALSAVLPPI